MAWGSFYCISFIVNTNNNMKGTTVQILKAFVVTAWLKACTCG
jgi:hypothetical protein